MRREPNPEAIAWYLHRSEDLLAELRERVQALRSRGGQIAGFAGAVLALAGTNAESILDPLEGASRVSAGVSLLTGIVLLVASLVAALRGSLALELESDISVKEVINYNSGRFVREPDLWRVHLRTIRGLSSSIEVTARQADGAARTTKRAEYVFLAGLFSVGVALAILLLVVTF